MLLFYERIYFSNFSSGVLWKICIRWSQFHYKAARNIFYAWTPTIFILGIYNKRLIIWPIPVKACLTVECRFYSTFWYVKQQQVVSKSCLNFLGRNSRLSIKKAKVKTTLQTFIFSRIKFHFKVYRDKREKEYRIRFQLRDFSKECKKRTKLKSILSTLNTDSKGSYVFHGLRHSTYNSRNNHCLVYRYGYYYIFLF